MTQVYFKVKVESSNFEIDLTGTYPKIHLRSKPQGGRANRELVERLSSILGKDVGIVSGHKSKRKKVNIEGLSREEIERKLERFASD